MAPIQTNAIQPSAGPTNEGSTNEDRTGGRRIENAARTGVRDVPGEGERDEAVLIAARDGFPLAATLHRAKRSGHETGGRRVVVVAPATGVARTFYRRFARFMAGRGFDVVTFDYRGIGGSRIGSLRGFRATMSEWAEQDQAGVLDYAKGALGATDLTLVGHSFGGQAVGLIPNADLIDKFVGVGAQLGDLRLYPAPARHAYTALMAGLIPVTTGALGFWPMSLVGGEDLPRGVAREWARWCLSPGYYAGDVGSPFRERLATFKAPTRLYSFDDDRYAPAAAVDALAALLSSAPVERCHLQPEDYGGRLGHFSFFRPRFESSLWFDVVRFLETDSARSRGEVSLDEYMFNRALRAS